MTSATTPGGNASVPVQQPAATVPSDFPQITLHASADWYRQRPEAVQAWQGVLRRRSEVIGPGTRAGLGFALATGSGELPIYSAGVDRELDRFMNRDVVVAGKLVDLGSEGAEPEIWPATIRPAASGVR